MFELSKRSRNKLIGVHEDLVLVVKCAIERTKIDFTVLEGLRSLERQQSLVNLKKSQTMKSRHLTGHAVDLAALVDGKICWEPAVYENIAHAMKETSRDFSVPIEWGGDWKTFKDYVHWQLPWAAYPAKN